MVSFLLLGGLGSYLFAAALQQAPARGPKIWLGDNQALPVTPVGPATLAQNVAAGKAQPLSMTSADLDGDGVADLVAGFSAPGGGALVIHRGNLDAFAPQSNASFQAIGRGQFPSPFLPDAQVISIPVRPDFVAAGNFTASGHLDLVAAARGGNSLYVFAGDGKGNFAAPQTVNLTGGVTALGAENLVRGAPYSNLVVGITTPQDSALLVFSGSPEGLGSPVSVSLSAAASAIAFGDFGDSNPDTAFLAGGDVFVLHTSSMQVEALNLPVSASALALGSFIYDRHPHVQIALLTSDGSIHIAAHNEFDPHALSVDEMKTIRQAVRNGEPNPLIWNRAVAVNGWKIVETVPAAAQFAAGQPPVLFRTRISDHGADDVMVLNPSAGQMAVISHPDPAPDAPTFGPAQVSTRPYAGSPAAALPMRTNIDGRPGVVALHAGQLAPAVMMPLPDPTFFPNRFDDITPRGTGVTCLNTTGVDASNDCTLREAVLKANATAGTDTIQLQAGTYQLSLAKVANDFTGNHGALYVNDSVNIIGAGQATTIIQAGTTNANGVDMVMAVNEDINPITNATASISNLTLKFGHNNGTHGNDGDGGCMEFDTGSSGNANLTLTNVTLTDCSTTKGNGAGIAIFNFTLPNNGLATITNSIIQNNSAVDTTSGVAATAGGVWVSFPARMLMTNSQVINNSATQVSSPAGAAGEGGGITITGQGNNTRQTVIHGSTISGNHAGGNGGGIHSESNLQIDQSSIISNNSGGEANVANAKDGGGLWLSTSTNGCPGACTDFTTLTNVTITGNTTTGNGGGIHTGNNTGAGNLTMNFSRLAGNTAAAGSNLANDHTTASVTDNWWGTNSPSSTINNNVATTTFDPFIQLTHTALPAVIRINQSTTLTGDLSKDNHGVAIGASGLTEIVGLPITFNNPVLGTIPQAQPETLDANAQATATFNAGGTSGLGHADATVDQATVTVNIPVLEPLRITKSFVPGTIAINGTSTLTFSVNNPNVIAVDASFTDTFPANLVVANPPSATNTCGGTFAPLAGNTSVTFSNGSLPVGVCTITVHVTSAVDSVYSNSVTINSTAAGTGALSTSSASLTVINPPHIVKAFGAATIPLNGTTSLTFTIDSNSNQNLTLTGVAFTDNLPAGLVVATPGNPSTTCSGGVVTAADGSSSVSLSGASVAPTTSCTISVTVQGTTAGVKNNSVQVTSTNGGTGNTANASITVVAPPTISKAFGAASIPLNGTTSVTFTINNPNLTAAGDLTGVAFSDTLPSATGTLVVAPTPNVSNTCGGTVTATAGTGVISLSGASVAHNASCTLSVDVQGTAAGSASNTTGAITSTEGGTGTLSNTAIIHIEAPPVIAKVFNPTTIALNSTTSLTFTITNPAANVDALTGVAFTDTLPTGLTVANSSATVCGGTLTTTAPTGIVLTGATIAVNSQCQFSVTVTGAASGQYTNTTGNVTSTNGGTGNTATANLTVAAPPTITKAFGAAKIPLNGTTSLSFTITNPNTFTTLSGVAFTDNLPSGLVVAATPNVTGSCGSGTITAVAGSGTISLSGGTLTASPAAGSSCTFSVDVTGTTAGVKLNTTGAITSTEGGTGTTSNTASLTVVAPPTISKAFNPTSIALNATSTLSFTITNPNTASALSGVAFTDNLPAGVVVAATPNVTGSCGSGTITAVAGSGSISLSGGTLTASPAAGSSCTFSVDVTGTTAGAKSNTTGAISSTEGGTGVTSNTAVLTVIAPPSIAKVFNPATIALNATTSLTFTITNPAANTVALAGVAFTDTLPTGLTVANASATVCGGTLTTTAPTGIALTGATIAVNSQCQFSVTVTGAASGIYTNTTGNVSSTNGGTGNTASANLTVASAPTITKSFNPTTIALNTNSTLSFTINNPNTNVALSGVAFTDSLPAGLVVASPNGVTGSCGSGTITATAGSGTISLSGGTLTASPGAGSSCTFSVNVTGTTAGVKNNSVTVTSTEGGTGNTSNASITVIASATISKAFGAATIPLNGSTSLSFNIQNTNTTTTLTGVAFSDTLPAGLVVSTPNGLTGSCGGGTITAVAGSGSVSLTGASLAASASCTFSVNVTGTTAGTKVNTTGAITSTEGGTGGTATASIDVVAPPAIAKAFNPTVIAVNGVSTLTFTITNPAANAVAETGVAFTDTLPAGIVVATPNGLTDSCGGTATAVAGSGSISLSGGTVAASSSCTVTVDVTGSAPGVYNNTSGAVSSTNGGTGNTASATLTIAVADMTITKIHNGTFTRGETGATYTITVKNSGAGPTSGTVTVVDTLPNVTNPPVATAISGTGWTCTLGTLTCTRSDVLAPGASYPAITLTVNIPINIQNNFTNKATVSGGGETNTGNDTATDTVSLGPPIVITPQTTTSTVKAGSAAAFAFNVEDDDPTLGMVTFGCSGLPGGTTCTFNPPSTNLPLSQVNLTITTSNNAIVAAAGQDFGGGNSRRLYAAWFFPVLGLVGIAVGGRKNKKARLKLAVVLMGIVTLLAFAGCGGGAPRITTPAGSFQITVTAATTTVQANTQVTMTVQ